MKTSGLTKKRMANERFRKNEQAILTAYYKLKDYPGAKKLARAAGVSRTTLYRHHKIIQAIPVDYEDFLFRAYKETIRHYLVEDVPIKTLFLRTLVFIHCNREIIQALFRAHHKEIVEKILDYLRPRTTQDWCAVSNPDKVYKVYKNEIMGIIEEWNKQGLSRQDIGLILDNILYLTESAYRSLLPLR